MINPQEHLVFVSFIEGTPEDREDKLAKFFRGGAAKWASNRFRRMGDVIIPKHACFSVVGNVATARESVPHGTYFVEHHYTDPKTEESHHLHHVVCDCVVHKRLTDEEGKVKLDACPELERVASLRAQRYGREFTSAATKLELDDQLLAIFAEEHFAVEAIEHFLAVDKVQPEVWPGTIVSGELPVAQVVQMIPRSEEEVVEAAQTLQQADRVVFDGEVIRLAA
jgi:hypothetical protein